MIQNGDIETKLNKSTYKRSARSEARIAIKNNATSILQCWTLCPFRWKKNRFKCAYCEEDFTECTSLRGHVRVCSTLHTVADIYRKYRELPVINIDTTDAICCFCSTPFTDVIQMRAHTIRHGFEFNNEQPDGVLPFSLDKDAWNCVICKEKFNNFLKLYEHMNVHYQHYICAICGKGYMTATRLRKHSEVHVTGTFPCNECPKIFTMRASRDAHKATVHPKTPRYECPYCNMRFDGYYNRMAHLKDAHREKEVSYDCGHCELSFKTSGKRSIHIRTVHFPPKSEFGCMYCEWQFKTNYELKRHMIKHTGEKSFHCSVCGSSFSRNKALINHMKVHQKFICKTCGNEFKQRTQLLAHIRTVHQEVIINA